MTVADLTSPMVLDIIAQSGALTSKWTSSFGYMFYKKAEEKGYKLASMTCSMDFFEILNYLEENNPYLRDLVEGLRRNHKIN